MKLQKIKREKRSFKDDWNSLKKILSGTHIVKDENGDEEIPKPKIKEFKTHYIFNYNFGNDGTLTLRLKKWGINETSRNQRYT